MSRSVVVGTLFAILFIAPLVIADFYITPVIPTQNEKITAGTYSAGGETYTQRVASDYTLYFKTNSNLARPVRFEKDGYYFTYDISQGQLLWAAQPGFPARTDTLGGGYSSNTLDTVISVAGSTAIYANAFSTLVDAKYEVTDRMVKETYTLRSLPSIKPYTYLQLGGRVTFNRTLQICANGRCYTPSGTSDDFNTTGQIDFRDNSNNTIFYLRAPVITDSANRTTNGIYMVKGSDAQMGFDLRIPTSFLESAVFPVFIDPTIISQNDSMVVYTDDDMSVTAVLEKWDGSQYQTEPDTIWINDYGDVLKLGAVDSANTGTAQYLYTVTSNTSFIANNMTPYIVTSSFTLPDFFEIFFGMADITTFDLIEKKVFDFSDICLKDGASCVFTYGEDSKTLNVTFNGDANIDPSIYTTTTTLTAGAKYERTLMETTLHTRQQLNDTSERYLVLDGTDDYARPGIGADITYGVQSWATDFSLGGWYRWDDVTQTPQYLFSRQQQTSAGKAWYGYSLRYHYNTGKTAQGAGQTNVTAGDYLIFMVTYTEDVNNANAEVFYNFTPVAGQWYHIFAAYDGGGATTMRVYVDGVNLTARTIYSTGGGSSWGVGTSAQTRIGARWYVSDTGSLQPFEGGVDDVMWFRRYLSASDVAALYAYNRSAPNNLTGMTGFWEFDDYKMNPECNANANRENGATFVNGPYTRLYFDSQQPANWNPIGGGLIGYWNFDDSSTTVDYDMTRSSNDGTFAGGAYATTSAGKYDEGLYCDGTDDYVNVGNDATFRTLRTDNFTLSAWVYSTETSGVTDVILGITGSGETEAANGLGQMAWVSTSSVGDISVGHEYGAGSNEIYSFDTNLAINTWHHIVETKDYTNKNITLYINGTKFGSWTYTTQATGGTSALMSIGSYADAGGNFFQGYIDEAMVFDRKLTDAEVSNLYNSNSSRFFVNGTQYFPQVTQNMYDNNSVNMVLLGAEQTEGANISTGMGYWQPSMGYNETTSSSGMNNDLVAYWHADGNANDASGNGFHGTLSGTVTNQTGKYNLSFGFNDTNDCVNVSDNSAFTFVSGTQDLSFSLGAWVYVPSTVTGIIIMKNGGTGGTNREWGFTLSSSAPYIFTGDDSSTAYIGKSCAALSSGAWHHLVTTYDGNTNNYGFRIYADGVRCDSATYSTGTYTSMENTAQKVQIGGSGTASLTSYIDEVMVWNRTVTAEEVRELYTMGRANWNYTGWDSVDYTTTPYAYETEVNPISCWLDNVNDSCGGNNNGTASGATFTSTNRETIGNKTMYFDGTSDYIEVPHNANLNLNTTGSISVWIRPTTWGDNSYGRIVDKTNDATATGGYTYYLFGASATVGFLTFGSSSVSAATNAIALGRWQHVAVTWNSTGYVRHYVNGVLSGTPANTGSPSNINTTSVLHIGGRSGGTDYDYNGYMDEVVLYNSTLTAPQIYNIYKGSKHFRANSTHSFGNGTTNLLPMVLFSHISDFFYTSFILGSGDLELGLTGDITSPVVTITCIGPDCSAPYVNSVNPIIVYATTNEPAYCRASYDGDESYEDMADDTDCTGDATNSHACSTGTLADAAYTVYVACEDGASNTDDASENAVASFTHHATPPVVTMNSIGGDTSAPYLINDSTPWANLTTDENATCRASKDGDESYTSMADDITCTGTNTSHNCSMYALSEGASTLYVACIDTYGAFHTAATNYAYSVTVDTTGPVITWVSTENTTITTTSHLFSITTNENANCTLRLNGTTSYVNATSSTGTTWMVTGLSQINYTQINASCDDATFGNNRVSTNRWLHVDNLFDVEWNWTDINSTIYVDHTYLCANSTESMDNCTFRMNSTLTYTNTTDGDNLCYNFTSLTDGNYTSVNATCFDLYGNTDFTTNAWVNVITCTPDWQNTSWGGWTDNTTCYTNDSKKQDRNLTQYDANSCFGSTNTTFYEYQWAACNYCSYNLTNTSWSYWVENSTCYANDTYKQVRNRTQYDSNASTCCAVTGLPSDCPGANVTFYDYRHVTCNCSMNTSVYRYGIEWVWWKTANTTVCPEFNHTECFVYETAVLYDSQNLTALEDDLFEVGLYSSTLYEARCRIRRDDLTYGRWDNASVTTRAAGTSTPSVMEDYELDVPASGSVGNAFTAEWVVTIDGDSTNNLTMTIINNNPECHIVAGETNTWTYTGIISGVVTNESDYVCTIASVNPYTFILDISMTNSSGTYTYTTSDSISIPPGAPGGGGPGGGGGATTDKISFKLLPNLLRPLAAIDATGTAVLLPELVNNGDAFSGVTYFAQMQPDSEYEPTTGWCSVTTPTYLYPEKQSTPTEIVCEVPIEEMNPDLKYAEVVCVKEPVTGEQSCSIIEFSKEKLLSDYFEWWMYAVGSGILMLSSGMYMRRKKKTPLAGMLISVGIVWFLIGLIFKMLFNAGYVNSTSKLFGLPNVDAYFIITGVILTVLAILVNSFRKKQV